MDFWIIRDGEKAGPYPDYEIRRRIESGELSPSDPIWSESMAEWTPIAEVELFRITLERPPVLPPPLPAQAVVAPPMWRRFWARMFDFTVYGAFLWGALTLGHADLKAIAVNRWFVAVHLIPWFLIEIGLIHWFATTPGKALLGLKVLNRDGSKLSLVQSLRRAALVCVAGVGLGMDLLFPICLTISWVSLRRVGVSLWDFVGGHETVRSYPAAWRTVAFVFLFLTAMNVQGWLLKPVAFSLKPEELEQMPAWFRDFYEKARQESL